MSFCLLLNKELQSLSIAHSGLDWVNLWSHAFLADWSNDLKMHTVKSFREIKKRSYNN